MAPHRVSGRLQAPVSQTEGALTINVVVDMTNDEDAICDLLDDFTRALYEKDAASAIAPLADDAVAFDLAPPLKQDPDVLHDPARLE